MRDSLMNHYPPEVWAAMRQTLLRSAHYVEHGGNVHPVLAICSVQKTPWKRAAAARRLFEVVGTAKFEHSRDASIDLLVAAAYW